MNLSWQKILLVVAIVLFVIFAMIGADWIDSSHPEAFLGFGLVAFAGAHL